MKKRRIECLNLQLNIACKHTFKFFLNWTRDINDGWTGAGNLGVGFGRNCLVVFAGLVLFCMFIFGGLGLSLCVSSCCSCSVFFVCECLLLQDLVVFVFNNVSSMLCLLLWLCFAWLFLIVWFCLSVGSSCVLAVLVFLCVYVFFLTTLQWICVWSLLFVIMFSVWLCFVSLCSCSANVFCVDVFFLTTLQWVCVWSLLFVIMFSVWLCFVSLCFCSANVLFVCILFNDAAVGLCLVVIVICDNV